MKATLVFALFSALLLALPTDSSVAKPAHHWYSKLFGSEPTEKINQLEKKKEKIRNKYEKYTEKQEKKYKKYNDVWQGRTTKNSFFTGSPAERDIALGKLLDAQYKIGEAKYKEEEMIAKIDDQIKQLQESQ